MSLHKQNRHKGDNELLLLPPKSKRKEPQTRLKQQEKRDSFEIKINSKIHSSYANSRKESLPEEESDMVSEFKKMGIETVQVTENQQDDIKKTQRLSFQDNYPSVSMGQGDCSKLLDFSHIAQRLKDESLTPSKKQMQMNPKPQFQQILTKLYYVKINHSEIYSILKKEGENFLENVQLLKNKTKMIEQIWWKKLREEQKFSEKVEKTCNELKEENKYLKKQLQKANKEKEKNNHSSQTTEIMSMKREKRELEYEIRRHIELNKELTDKLRELEDQQELSRHKKDQLSDRERQMREKYIVCFQKFSNQISSLEFELARLKEESKTNSGTYSQEKQEISQRFRVLEERELQIRKREHQLLQRQEVFKKQIQKNKFRSNEEDSSHQFKSHLINRDTMQSFQNLRNHFSPQNEYKSKYQSRLEGNVSPKNFRSQYFSPQNQMKYSSKYHSNHHKISSRIGNIESNVRKELEELFRRKNS